MDEAAPPTEPTSSESVICPNCGAPVPFAPSEEITIVRCPFCETEFDPRRDPETEDREVEWQEPNDPESELDGLRIRNLIQLRRSAIRARTYAVVVLVCCLVMCGQLILTDFQEVGSYGWDRWAILYAISAGVLLLIAMLASAKAASLHRESNISAQIAHEQDPQFEGLSDGSQQVKNLEQMQSPPAESSRGTDG